jgi:hypothetical protein
LSSVKLKGWLNLSSPQMSSYRTYLSRMHCPTCVRWFTPGRAHSKNAKWYRP